MARWRLTSKSNSAAQLDQPNIIRLHPSHRLAEVGMQEAVRDVLLHDEGRLGEVLRAQTDYECVTAAKQLRARIMTNLCH